MSSGATAWLLHALLLVALSSALWVLISGPAYIAKIILGRLGALAFPARLAGIATKLGTVGPAVALFFERARTAFEGNSDLRTVRLALDERHTRLALALKRTEVSVDRAVGDVRGLSGVSGPGTVLDTVKTLQERTKLVDAIAVEFEGDLESKYAAHARTRMTLIFVSLFALVFASANGTLLNLFFRSLISVRIVGVPASLLLSIMIVVAEMALGFVLAWMTRRPRSAPIQWLVGLMIGLAACFEAVVLGMVSNDFDLDFPLFDTYPVLKLWMAPLGLVLVTATSITGFMFHQTLDELAEHRGATRLKRELAQANSFVHDLPGIWEKIGQKAREAETSIKSYLDSLGGHDGRVTGVIEKLSAERDQLVGALRDARPDEWSSLIIGDLGDQRRAAAQNIGLCVFTLLGVGAYAAGLSVLTQAAIGTRLPALASVAMSIVVALGFYAVGLLAFRRLQLTEGSNGRAQPMRAGVLEYSVAGVIVAGCGAGIIWASTVVLGAWGVLLGLLLVACGGLLAIAGYGLERAVRGFTLIATVSTALVFACVGAGLSLLRYAVLWLLAALTWILTAAVSLMAAPVELIIQAFRGPSRTVVEATVAPTQIAA